MSAPTVLQPGGPHEEAMGLDILRCCPRRNGAVLAASHLPCSSAELGVYLVKSPHPWPPWLLLVVSSVTRLNLLLHGCNPSPKLLRISGLTKGHHRLFPSPEATCSLNDLILWTVKRNSHSLASFTYLVLDKSKCVRTLSIRSSMWALPMNLTEPGSGPKSPAGSQPTSSYTTPGTFG